MDLKKTRLSFKLTQVEIAQALGISVNTWRNYEVNGKEMPIELEKKLESLIERFESAIVEKIINPEKSKSLKIKNYLLQALKLNGTNKPVFIDLVDRYICMWETSIKLEKDINEKGVTFESPTGWKKNDSVAMLVNVNKQMLMILDKLNLNANTIRAEDGVDV